MRDRGPGFGLVRGGLVLLALTGCKKKVEPVIPPLPPAESRLQVVSLSPSSIQPDEPAVVQVYGSGFVDGAGVSVSGIPALEIAFRSENQLQARLPPLAEGAYDLVVVNPDESRAVLRGGLAVRAGESLGCELVTLYFDTNRSDLLPAADRTLTELIPCYQGTEKPIRIAGHADERGTIDYNLSLSLSRALAVRDWLLGAGFPKERLPVTSYGEEQPAVPGSNEDAWSRNRRVELTVE